ncbi:hypothetical protein GPALN_010769, partial [Globodera pallida]
AMRAYLFTIFFIAQYRDFPLLNTPALLRERMDALIMAASAPALAVINGRMPQGEEGCVYHHAQLPKQRRLLIGHVQQSPLNAVSGFGQHLNSCSVSEDGMHNNDQ